MNPSIRGRLNTSSASQPCRELHMLLRHPFEEVIFVYYLPAGQSASVGFGLQMAWKLQADQSG